YAVGVMLYQMLTGEIPRGMWVMPGKKLGTDPRFDAIIAKAMQTDRESRYQSAAELRRDLDTLLTTPRASAPAAAASPAPQAAARPASRPSAPKPAANEAVAPPPLPPKSSFGLILGIGSACAVGLLAWLVTRPSPPAAEPQVAAVPALNGKAVVETPLTVPDSPPAPAPPSPDPSSPEPPPVRPVIVEHDLLALTDPLMDRAPLPRLVRRNEWRREDGGGLAFQSDGQAGRLAAPVAFECADYEIEFKARKLEGSERVQLNLPAGEARELRLVFNSPNRKVMDGREGVPWRQIEELVHVSARIIHAGGGKDRVYIRRLDGAQQILADVTADIASLAADSRGHPAFPGRPVLSVFLPKDAYRIETLRLRVFEGGAGVLREPGELPILTHGGSRWQFQPGAVSWNEARDLAAARGGHLATITDQETYDWIKGEFISKQAPGLAVWLGGEKKPDTPVSDWAWVTGESFAFRAFQPGAPSGTVPHFGLAWRRPPEADAAQGDSWWPANPGQSHDISGFLIEWDEAPPASMPAPATVMEAPALPPDDFITKLESGFKARFDADAQTPFLAAVARLDQSYLANGLPRARAAAQARGSLAEVTALDEETARVGNKEGMPAEDVEGTPEALKTLRQTYRAAFAKLAAERDARAAPLYDIYLKSLDGHIAVLTKAGKITEATAAQAWRDRIAERRPVNDSSARIAATQPAKAAPSVTAPKAAKASTPTGGGSSWRVAADYLVNNGGSFVSLKGGATITVTKPDEIPSGRFDIIELSLDRLGSALPSPVDTDFAAFSGLRDLRRLWLRSIPALTDAALAFVAANDDLTFINFEGVNALTDAVTMHLEPLKKLDYLAIQYAEGFTGGGLGQLASKDSMRTFEFLSSGITDEGMRAVGTFKKLQTLRVTSQKVTPAGFAPLAGLTSLTSLTLSGTQFDDTSADAVAGLLQLSHLDLANTKLGDAGLAKLKSLKKLSNLYLSGTAVSGKAAGEFQLALPQCRVSR
ncbi:MAG TPA: hypothetical protein DIT64_17170, partial [Verrucomicrobiales bacterium]|nr:hypothetical protein [Verrucomicrobiales bacterium]